MTMRIEGQINRLKRGKVTRSRRSFVLGKARRRLEMNRKWRDPLRLAIAQEEFESTSAFLVPEEMKSAK